MKLSTYSSDTMLIQRHQNQLRNLLTKRRKNQMKSKTNEEDQLYFRILTTCFAFLCLIGLTYQSFLMISTYFNYSVSTTVNISLPIMIEPKSLSICTRWTDVLNYESYS